MIALKFGGTSLGDAARFKTAASIVQSRRGRAPIVVASAMGGATNDLLRAAREAASHRESGALAILDALAARHLATADELGVLETRVDGLPGPVGAYLAARFVEARERLRGVAMLAELTDRTSDAIASTGELASSAVLAALVPGAAFVDAREIVRTDDRFGAARPRRKEIEALVRDRLEPGRLCVTQGFIGSTAEGITTTLGRGGSDYSASLLGAAAGASEIEIWTDVDGMMTADPRIVPEAKLVSEATFQEASELAYFGAKVLHPATIRPAVKRGIPVRILNTFRPEGAGTLIRNGSTPPPAAPVRAIAARAGITVVLITNPRMLAAEGYGARVFEAFDRHDMAIGLIATSEVSISLTIEDAARLPAVTQELSSIADVSALPAQAIVAVVGTGLRSHPGVAARVFGAIGDLDVNLISMGASDRNLSFVVPEEMAEEAVRRLHATFFP